MSNRDLKLKIWKRDGLKCRYCGIQLLMPPSGSPIHDLRYATVDHVVPISRGGRTIKQNLITACLPCNQSKAQQEALDFRLSRTPASPPPAGSSATPETQPAASRGVAGQPERGL